MNNKSFYEVKSNGSGPAVGASWQQEEQERGRSTARLIRHPSVRPSPRFTSYRPRTIRRINYYGDPAFTAPEPGVEGSDYVRWIQTSLNLVLNLQLPISGIFSVQTRSAIRSFQEKYNLPVTGILGPDTERALMAALGSQSSGFRQEGEFEGVEAAAAGFEILKSVITPMTQGDVQVTWPSSPIGVTWSAKPTDIQFNTRTSSQIIIDFVETHPWFGYEFVNIKLRCFVQYNGPEVQASFSFDAEGRRSRLATDTSITINNPLSLETIPTSANWQSIGVKAYPVIRIPVEFRIDRPWPLSNYNETFTLVLSGMYGFGASASDLQHIKDRRVLWT